MTSNKELQESRIRGYFIDATKETLKGEGLKAVNVRAVSERAGYSFATLYNYFKDLNELVFICVQDFMTECEDFTNELSASATPGADRLKARMLAYIKYFTQYPGIFELFYIERMNDLGARQPTAQLIYKFIDRIAMEDIIHMIENNNLSQEESQTILLSLRNVIPGMLIHYINRLQPAGYQEFILNAEKQINFITGEKHL